MPTAVQVGFVVSTYRVPRSRQAVSMVGLGLRWQAWIPKDQRTVLAFNLGICWWLQMISLATWGFFWGGENNKKWWWGFPLNKPWHVFPTQIWLFLGWEIGGTTIWGFPLDFVSCWDLPLRIRWLKPPKTVNCCCGAQDIDNGWSWPIHRDWTWTWRTVATKRVRITV